MKEKLPQNLFKYLKREFADTMLNDGKIQIGTFYYFRKMEEHGADKVRGDANEGILTKTLKLNRETDIRELPGEFHKNISLHPGVKYTVTQKASLRTEAADTYIYCCSKTYSRKLMKSFQCDTCIEIFDVELFRQALLTKLVDEGCVYNFGGSGPCHYIGHEVGISFKETSHFLKDKRYSNQAEYRFIYLPIIKDNNGNIVEAIVDVKDDYSTFTLPESTVLPVTEIKPIIIECKEATQYCRI